MSGPLSYVDIGITMLAGTWGVLRMGWRGVGEMSIRISAARVAVAVSLGTLLLVPMAADARSGGVGLGAHHRFAGSTRLQRHRAFDAVPYAGFAVGTLSNVSYGESGPCPRSKSGRIRASRRAS